MPERLVGDNLEPFRIEVPQSVLDDLRERLDRTRWPDEPAAAPWRYGTSLHYLQDVLAYWRRQYDWRRWERELGRFAHYRARIGGERVHFLLEPGSGSAPLPLVLTHGWPGSFAEFLAIIEPLAHPERFGGDPEDAFTVVVPSLPGYAFSDPPAAPITPAAIAATWDHLLRDVLGFERYVAHGGDWGGVVTSLLALRRPAGLAAIHLTNVPLRPSRTGEAVSAEEEDWLVRAAAGGEGELAYQQVQATKPQTLAYGLTDSPAGLAAWILEKFHGWTVPRSTQAPPFDLECAGRPARSKGCKSLTTKK